MRYATAYVPERLIKLDFVVNTRIISNNNSIFRFVCKFHFAVILIYFLGPMYSWREILGGGGYIYIYIYIYILAQFKVSRLRAYLSSIAERIKDRLIYCN